MKTQTSLLAVLTLAILSACQSKQQLTATPGTPGSANTQNKNSQATLKQSDSTQGSESETEQKVTDLRLDRLSFETKGSNDLSYTLEVNQDGKTILHLLRYKLSAKSQDFEIQEPLLAQVKDLFAGKAHYGGTLLQENGKELDLNPDQPSDEKPKGDFYSTILLQTKANEEWTIRAPVILTKGMETLFDDLRNFIDASLNPKPESPSCKDLADLEGSQLSILTSDGKSTKTKSPLTKVPGQTVSETGEISYEAEEGSTAQGAQGDTCVTYTYHPTACTLSKQPNGETKTLLKVLSVKKEGSTTKIDAQECEDASCSKLKDGVTNILLSEPTAEATN